MPHTRDTIRIPQEDLDRLKSTVDLATLVQSYGVQLQKHGTHDLIGLCPFHDDKNPSLVITPAKGLWHCLGACQKGGDVIAWVMQTQHVSFRHAVEVLREGDFTLLAANKDASKYAMRYRFTAPFSTGGEESDQAILTQTIDYYHKRLFETPDAMNCLKRRGIWHEEAVKHFKIGYADRSFTMRLPPKARKEGAHIRGRLEALGIIRETGHGHFNGGLVFPVMDENGTVTEIYGRKVNDGIRQDTAYHLYLPERFRTEQGLERGLWNPAALASQDVILCESIIDALSFWVNGFKNVTASYGINGFTADMLYAFVSHGVKRVYIAYDRDEAGERAALSLADKLGGEGIECLRVKFPLGMDANEYIQKTTPADKGLRILVESAQWLGRSGMALKRIPVNGQVKTIKQQVPAVAPTPEPAAEPQAKTETPEPDTAVIPCEKQGQDYHITLGDRQYRVRGLHKNLSRDSLRVNLRVFRGQKYYLDAFEFYNGRHREAFTLKAAEETDTKAEVIKRDLGRLLLKLEALQDEIIEGSLAKKEQAYLMSPQEKEAALAFLQAPGLIERITAHLGDCGYVGEACNKLTGYLAATSRKTQDPLGVVIQSSSGVGKSTLMDAVLRFMPPEEVAKYSSVTGQALFYMDESHLKHKILAIAEGEGAEKAGYSLKLLISEKELRISSTGKDPDTGRHTALDYYTQGPTMVFYTSTSMEIEPELLSRCVVLHVDESREQTEAILHQQRFDRTLEGKKHKRRMDKVYKLHHNIQRLLRTVDVYNPFSQGLSFSAEQHLARRNHSKYLNLIETIAFLHQYQRPLKKDAELGEYVEVTLEDIELANALAGEVLGQSLEDMSPQTCRVLEQIYALVQRICGEKEVEQSLVWLSRRQIREHTGLGNSQLAIHIHRLVELEYLVIHRGGNGAQYVYELLYQGEGRDGGRFFMGLINVDELRQKMQNQTYDKNLPGVKADLPALAANLPGSFRGASGVLPARFRSGENAVTADNIGSCGEPDAKDPEMQYIEEINALLHRTVVIPVRGVQMFQVLCNFIIAECEREASSFLAANAEVATGTHG